MMGGALYKKYFNDNQDDDYILKLALDELKKQFKSKDDLKPKSYKVSILRVSLLICALFTFVFQISFVI